MDNKYDIAIIDTGLDLNHKGIDYSNYEGIHFFLNSNEEICMDKNIADEIGHGTAVYFLMRKQNPCTRILVVKIFEQEMESELSLLVEALKYILEHYEVKLINISNGVICADSLSSLRLICNDLREKGTIIVSAFANTGAISYPAAFSGVIGVDMSLSCKHIYDFEFVDSDLINIRAVGITQKLPWIHNEYKRVSGTSFSCPYISSYIYQNCIMNGINSFSAIMKWMQDHALKSYLNNSNKEIKHIFSIKKAITFPFNKEIHSIVKYLNLTSFTLSGVYDSKYMGNCGRKVSDFVGEMSKDYLIEDYKKINWEGDFDTVILGHTRELCAIINEDIRGYFVANCKRYNKKIVAFDNLKNAFPEEYEKGMIYTPIIEKDYLPQNQFGKLYKIGKPIICIAGTSSKQGKFTTQLYLRKRFLEKGYNVGSLGTEPSSELFGMDEVYPMGYDSTAYLDGQDEVTMINYQLHKIEEKEKDIIIVGSQSQTVAYSFENLRYIPIHQNNFLYACDADGYVLIVNYYDEDDYIQKNILYLENLSSLERNIIAIGLFPEENDLQWTCLTAKKKIVDYEMAKLRARQLEERFKIPVYVLGTENEKIFSECIKYFGEE